MQKTKILIISNCQVQPLKHGLSAVCRNIEIEALPVHVSRAEDRDATFAEYIAKKSEYACVLSIPLSGEFGALTRERIVESFSPTPVFGITNLTYKGLHPDITYVGGISTRAAGPIGDYHSQIALLAYLMGLTTEAAAKMYCDKVYACMDYYSEHQESVAELQRRDETTTIPVGELIEERLRAGLCFLSHNHPTSFLLAPYINKIADWLQQKGIVERSGQDILPEELVNFLAFSSAFPVFPELAKHHGLSFPGSYVFRTATVGDLPSSTLSLAEFIEAEYRSFTHVDKAFLLENYPGNLLMFKYGNTESFRTLVENL